MARKSTPTLTEAELRVMSAVWGLEEASVNDVLSVMPLRARPAYNTVLTIMRILERKGYLEHVKEGRAYVYRPLVNQKGARRKAVRHMIRSFFEDSPRLLMLSLMEDEKITPEELEQLKKMVDERE
jgi:BlaI family transcriptional regulator, penicillinase repressor